MPPKKLSKSEIEKQAAALAKMFGFDAKQTAELISDNAPLLINARERESLQAESVLFYLERRSKAAQLWKDITCKWCGDKFKSIYANIAYCSDMCRALKLKSEGLIWNPHGRSEFERWGGRIPKVIGAEATKQLVEWEKTAPEPEKDVIDQAEDLLREMGLD